MSGSREQESGVVGGTMDETLDTTLAEPSDVIDQVLARRHEAERRGKLAAERARKLKHSTP